MYFLIYFGIGIIANISYLTWDIRNFYKTTRQIRYAADGIFLFLLTTLWPVFLVGCIIIMLFNGLISLLVKIFK